MVRSEVRARDKELWVVPCIGKLLCGNLRFVSKVFFERFRVFNFECRELGVLNGASMNR